MKYPFSKNLRYCLLTLLLMGSAFSGCRTKPNQIKYPTHLDLDITPPEDEFRDDATGDIEYSLHYLQVEEESSSTYLGYLENDSFSIYMPPAWIYHASDIRNESVYSEDESENRTGYIITMHDVVDDINSIRIKKIPMSGAFRSANELRDYSMMLKKASPGELVETMDSLTVGGEDAALAVYKERPVLQGDFVYVWQYSILRKNKDAFIIECQNVVDESKSYELNMAIMDSFRFK